MGFGDLKSDSSIKALNDFLSDKSYIDGFVPSQGDAVVFNAITKAPTAKYNHALRWYNHIKSYGNDSAKFPGAKKPVGSYGPAGVPAAAKGDDDDDDDDFDLFGSDDEDDDAAEKLKEERLAAYAAKKSKIEGAGKDPQSKPKPKPKEEDEEDDEDDDDFDLFGDDDDSAKQKAEKLKQERVDAYTAKKAKKPALIAKSSIILDVKPWDDETDMAELEKQVRTIEADGMVWGASKLVPVGYGIKKLQIIVVVEDDKIGTDFLEEKITAFEDFVQSVDVAAFNKI